MTGSRENFQGEESSVEGISGRRRELRPRECEGVEAGWHGTQEEVGPVC